MDGHHNHNDGGEYAQPQKKSGKVHNVLPLWGNESSMNLNALILANIQSSSYFKVHLFKLKTYHEVVDEIYYQVKHLEPWERGSRKTAGQTGMCGGVRGVGAGGIVSTAYCLLYKLYTLRLTRKQLNGLLTHTDSPYIRSLGFMYIRYTQPPADLFDWYEEYLQDEEEVDAKAGGGGPTMTIGQMLHQFLVKLEWFSTLFPRIPVPIQKQIEKRLCDYSRANNVNLQARYQNVERDFNASHNQANGRQDKPGGSGGGGREYFDSRNRDRDRAPTGRSDQRGADDRRYRSRSRERNGGNANRRDRSVERSAYGNDGKDRYSKREKDGYSSRDGDRNADDRYADYDRYKDSGRNRDKKYR